MKKSCICSIGLINNLLYFVFMLDFQSLKNLAKKSQLVQSKPLKLAVMGNYATQFLSKSLEYSGKVSGFETKVYTAEYDQIELEIVNPGAELYAFEPDFVLISISSLKLLQKYYGIPEDRKSSYARDYLDQINNLLTTFSSRSGATVILHNLEIINDQVFGNLYSKVSTSFTKHIYDLNAGFIRIAEAQDQVFLFDLNGLIQYYGSSHVRDWSQYVHSDMHFSLDFHAVIAEKLMGFIATFRGIFKKCLILDLDNTLWGGVIGDDGMQGIEIGALGIGKAFTEFQKWIKQLKERGILLAVCSKNTESVAKEPFEKHPEMVLHLDDIAVFMANWENKADNVRVIKEILNIGYDSMVFVDDNPAEREVVRQNLPEVTVPELPEDPVLYLDFLKSLHLFDTASYSATDKDRTQQYQVEAQRAQLQTTVTDMPTYLKSLEMQITIEPFQAIDIPRIAQLNQRSNQFNLRTIRYTESEMQAISGSGDYYPVSVKLKDKFGDYGLISVLILKKIDTDKLFIDTWIMSCRVLKRGVEDAVLNHLAALAIQEDFRYLVGEYLPTAKNNLVKDHYANLGFTFEDPHWTLDTENFSPHIHYIKN